MRMVASALSAVVISTSVAAAASPQAAQPMASGKAAAMPADNAAKAMPAHESATATKIHAMSRRRVEEIQTALNKDGAQLAIDGIYGPKTRTAIEDFQKKNNLKVTGHADHATLHKLNPQTWS
jgi:peptidoglycan DL-endopeptidase CwlO